MKLNAWQVIALVAVLLAGLITSNIFAPGAVSTVTGIVTTLVALFVERAKDTTNTPPAELSPSNP